MVNDEMPTQYVIVGKEDTGVWISPIHDGGTVSAEKIFVPEDNRKVIKQSDANKMSKPAWGNAVQMFNAACVLRENELIIPSAALVSFSIELFMKSILLSNGKFSTEHKLDRLFALMDESSKNSLIAQITEETTESRFIDLLINNAATFEKIRYVHEYANVPFHLDFLFKLALVIRDLSAGKLGIDINNE